jgi:hypothetical protein
VKERTVILYHPTGEAIALEQETWRLALSVAADRGWQAAGTSPPPIALGAPSDTRWDGSYDTAVGQEVSRLDAAPLGQILSGIAAWFAESQLRRELERLAEFCAAGGFIVCCEADHSAGLQSLAEQVAAESRVSAKTAAEARQESLAPEYTA